MKTNRRNFLQTLGAGTAGFGLAPFSSNAKSKKERSIHPVEKEQQLFLGDDIAIADTQYGRVQGFIWDDVYHFRGIPYGADTSGENRFMPPQPPEPWGDNYPAVWWGDAAPQVIEGRRFNGAYQSFQEHWNYFASVMSEDCLHLNVWTPEINDNNRRPVIVWFHGGGFSNGYAIEMDGYKGFNLSRKGDVVFVSINHRLGTIGFSDLSGVGGERYANSGNVGALDMVASLEWVRDNIANFGGDPDNVTIIGQSGGGAKVCTLMAMPQAQGLFHKAVPLSGSTLQARDQDASRSIGKYILEEAGLNANQIDQLQQMPWDEYLQLANRAADRYEEEQGGNGGFGPVADGTNIAEGQFFSEADGLSSDVPMLICSTFHEWAMSRDDPELENISRQEAINRLQEQAGFQGGLGDRAEEVYNGYANAFPDAEPIEIMILIASNRQGLIETANVKSNQTAPVYVAWFGWEPPMFNGRMRAFHCLDICFWFENTDLMITHTGGGERPRALSMRMSDALLQFMRTGNPNTSSLPEWPVYTQENGETMILDDVCVVKNDPDREGRELLSG